MQLIPQGGPSPPPWGIVANPRNRDIRISSDRLGKGFFLIFGKSVQNPKSHIFCIFNLDKSHENRTSSASIEPHMILKPCPSCRSRKKLQTGGIETSIRPNPTLVFSILLSQFAAKESGSLGSRKLY